MKSVLIPGGTGALGHAVTHRLIDEGYRCIVPYRSESEAQRLRAGIVPQQREQLFLLEADLLRDDEVARVFEAAVTIDPLHGFVHLLGGIRGFQTIADTSIEDWDALIQLNLRPLFLFSRLIMSHFRANGFGRIITIGAMAAAKPAAKQAGYGVSKAGVSALTKILADEGRDFGVTANCILPSVIDTPANREWGTDEEIARWVSPEEIAGTISFLLREDAAGVNGSDIRLFGKLNI
ncbi:MAG: SDR family oxidoreductase [Bacteroidota bacterium]|jgi:NAD(P)-dependent dehydrogenase (short-subunit alcohol dehydrogenase family)|nr:SDR family oxidoreductase [Bacteroidota bacterium]